MTKQKSFRNNFFLETTELWSNHFIQIVKMYAEKTARGGERLITLHSYDDSECTFRNVTQSNKGDIHYETVRALTEWSTLKR